MTHGNIDISSVMVDFDETFIREKVLVTWVFHIFFHSELSFLKKIAFVSKAFLMGAISIPACGFKSTAKYGVRIAYLAFKDIKTSTIDDMIKTGSFHLNKKTMMILRAVMKKAGHKPQLSIVSQGSPCYLIRRFLKKEDVMFFLKNLGIDPESIIIHANNMKSVNGKFTGKIKEPVETKFSRIKKIMPDMVFIGDKKDEKLLKKLLIRNARFINWENEIGFF